MSVRPRVEADAPATRGIAATTSLSADAANMLMAHVPAFVWITDRDLYVRSVEGNVSACPDPNALLGRAIRDLYRDERYRFVADAHERALAGQPGEYTAQWHDRVYEVRVEQRLDSEQRAIGVVGLAIDVTETKEREQRRDLTVAVSEVAIHGGELTDSLQQCARAAVDVLRLPLVRIWTTDADERTLHLRAQASEHLSGGPARLAVASLGAERVAAAGRPLRAPLPDVATGEQLRWATQAGLTVFDGFPLLASGKMLGVLTVASRQPASDRTHAALRAMADELTLVLDRERAHRELRASEARYRELFEQVRVPIVAFDAETLRIEQVNGATERRFGYSVAELCAARIVDLHAEPADAQTLAWLRSRGPGVRRRPFTYRCKDGRIRRVEVSLCDAPLDGRPLRIATILDVTERLNAERIQHQLLARVIEVQERERRRIARELHDHMGQHVAAQALMIRSLSKRVRGARAQEQLRELRESCATIGKELHELAFQLRPAALDDFGIAEALELLVRRWSERTAIPVEFAANGLQTLRIDAGIETAIYRIAQEAFTNVQKHARAKNVHVALTRARGNLVLVIRDDGRGMSREGKRPAQAKSGSGFGLLSMRERSQAIGGRLTIRSKPGVGTAIRVTVPLPAAVRE